MSWRLTVVGDARTQDFAAHEEKWSPCARCQIGIYATRKVFSRGILPCAVLFIGEAPGKDEDKDGHPFVGRSGRLVDGWVAYVESHMGVQFPSWAIINTVACRPTDRRDGQNRKPTEEEQDNCAPQFGELLKMAEPSVIVLLGKVAVDYWLGQPTSTVDQWPYLELPHPAYCLRQGGEGSIVSKAAQESLLKFLSQHF